MTQSRKILFLATLIGTCLMLAGWFALTKGHAPKSGSEALNRAIELQRAGRYDKAVEILRTWMKGDNRDTSHDGFLYQQIAMIYIAKAYTNPMTRGQSITEAQVSLEKSLDFVNGREPADNSLELDGIGGAYELLGDVSDKEKCQLYEKARGLFVRQLPLIKGDSYTSYGSTTPLEPVRVEIRKHLDAINEKIIKAGCQTQ